MLILRYKLQGGKHYEKNETEKMEFFHSPQWRTRSRQFVCNLCDCSYYCNSNHPFYLSSSSSCLYNYFICGILVNTHNDLSYTWVYWSLQRRWRRKMSNKKEGLLLTESFPSFIYISSSSSSTTKSTEWWSLTSHLPESNKIKRLSIVKDV